MSNPEHEHEPYVTVTNGIRGFYAVLVVWWCDEDDDSLPGFYDAHATGFGSYATEQAAVPEAVAWAQSEGVTFKLQGYDAHGNPLS